MIKSKTYSEVKHTAEAVLKTGDVVLDEFISNDNGFVVCSSIFLTGTSGAGKTTFAYTLQKIFENFVTALYSREMSAGSVKHQMKRYEMPHNNAYIADRESHPTLNDFMIELDILKPRVVVVDSLQVIVKEDYDGIMTEEKSCYDVIKKLREWTENNNAVLIVVGHVNKDDSFEGKNTIAHMFDAHLQMIFDKKKNTRTISWEKNRKGEMGELFYDFGKEKIEFFTPAQWEMKNQGKDLSSFIFDTLTNFIKIYKSKPYYKELRKELTSEWDKLALMTACKTQLDFVLKMTAMTQIIINKYEA